MLKSHLIVSRYKDAWENHDLKLLRDIFTEDAIYVEKLDYEPMKGIDQIVNYWITNSQQQEKVNFTPLLISGDHNQLEIIWRAKFFRKDLKFWFFLKGTMWLKLREGKIYHLSETFTKQMSS